jgi:hypothetical protein
LSDTSANALAASGHRPMGFPEFVIVIASIMALNPIAMDMMLPALLFYPGVTFGLTPRPEAKPDKLPLQQ